MPEQSTGSASQRTRRRIIRAAIESLAAGNGQRVRRALTVDDVAAQADLARRTIYTHFETIDDLVAAVIDDLEGTDSDTSGATGVRAIAEALVSLDDPSRWQARRALADMAGRDRLDDRLDPTPAVRELAGMLVSELATTARRPHAPLDDDRLVALLVAVTEWTHRIGMNEPDATALILSLAASLTHHGGMGARLDPGQALVDEATRRQALEEAGSEFPVLARTIVDTGLAVFDADGYADARLEDIARRCGLSMDLISSLVGSKADVARQLVSDLSISVAAGVDRGRATPGLRKALAEAAVAVARATDDHPAIVELMLAIDPGSRLPFGTELLATVSRVARSRRDETEIGAASLLPVLCIVPSVALVPADGREAFATRAVAAVLSH